MDDFRRCLASNEENIQNDPSTNYPAVWIDVCVCVFFWPKLFNIFGLGIRKVCHMWESLHFVWSYSSRGGLQPLPHPVLGEPKLSEWLSPEVQCTLHDNHRRMAVTRPQKKDVRVDLSLLVPCTSTPQRPN